MVNACDQVLVARAVQTKTNERMDIHGGCKLFGLKLDQRHQGEPRLQPHMFHRLGNVLTTVECEREGVIVHDAASQARRQEEWCRTKEEGFNTCDLNSQGGQISIRATTVAMVLPHFTATMWKATKWKTN